MTPDLRISHIRHWGSIWGRTIKGVLSPPAGARAMNKPNMRVNTKYGLYY